MQLALCRAVFLQWLFMLYSVSFVAADDLSVLFLGDDSGKRSIFAPMMTPKRTDVQPFEYVEVGAKIPNYVRSKRWGAQGELKTTMQEPLSPAESQKHFVTPEDFHVELFASEPDIGGKPIAMTWDHRGRLYVCETYDYPNEIQPHGKGRDRIRICADTDNDGKADKFTLFAEDLSIPTAIVAHRGGLIVQNGSETLFLKDTDGDDRADLRKVLIENWNVNDTHGGVSNFRLGLDNWIWGMQGYNHSEPIIDGKKQQSFRMGFFRFRLDQNDSPRVTDFEFIRSTDNNTWGLGLSEEGLVFGSTANHNPSVFMPIANRYYERVRGWTKSLALKSIADTHLFKPITDNVRQVDHFGGYTAGAGHALYTARRYPEEYWNRTAFVAGPTGHLVGTFVLSPRGSDFRSTSPFNLLASDDEWSTPILAEVGPDGNVWVIDWYNYIVQHNPTPQGFQTGKGGAYQSDLRDKKHGRIYRVVYGTDRENDSSRINDDASTAQLVALLTHPTMLQRQHAQRLLVERGNLDVLPALIELTSSAKIDSIGLNVGAIHALWTMHGLGMLDGSNETANQAALAALRHRSAGVRRAAIGVLPSDESSARAVLENGLLDDVDSQVRLAALLSLADLPATADGGKQIVRTMLRPANASDKWIPDAAMCAAANHSQSFLLSLCQQTKPSESLLAMATVVANHHARADVVVGMPELCEKIAAAQPEVASKIIRGLERGWPKDRPLSSATVANNLIVRLLPRMPLTDRGFLLKLAQRLGSDSIDEQVAKVRQSMFDQFIDPTLKEQIRIAAADQLMSLDPTSSETVTAILDQISPQISPELAVPLLRTLEASRSAELATRLLAKFPLLTPATRAAAISVLMSRPPLTIALLKAIGEGSIELGELSLDQRQLLGEHPNFIVRLAAGSLLSKEDALPNVDRQRVIDELAPFVTQVGDPENGKTVFTKNCANCHSHSGQGGKVGPDLTGIAVHPKEELLIHIIDPSRSVEGNFRIYTVLTVDGRVRSGILATESRTTIELVNAEGKTETLLRDEIDELVRSKKSLMPDGFEKQATREELRDLLEFLTQRGRFLPLDLTKVATISSARGMFYNKNADRERLLFDDWSPRTFRGIPFRLIDPNAGETKNVILLHSSNGKVSQRMPKSVSVPCRGTIKAVHMLSGVSGWGFNGSGKRTTSMIVRFHYADLVQEDHALKNGEHFADYIRRIDVPGSDFAYPLRDQQIRYLSISPERDSTIESIELVKGEDKTAPVVMAITLETVEAKNQER